MKESNRIMKYLQRIAYNFRHLMDKSLSFFVCVLMLSVSTFAIIVVNFPAVLIIAAITFILGRILIGIFTGF